MRCKKIVYPIEGHGKVQQVSWGDTPRKPIVLMPIGRLLQSISLSEIAEFQVVDNT